MDNNQRWQDLEKIIFNNCFVPDLESYLNTKLDSENIKYFKNKIFYNGLTEICLKWDGKFDENFICYAKKQFQKIIREKIGYDQKTCQYYNKETGEFLNLPTYIIRKNS